MDAIQDVVDENGDAVALSPPIQAVVHPPSETTPAPTQLASDAEALFRLPFDHARFELYPGRYVDPLSVYFSVQFKHEPVQTVVV